MTGWIHSVAYWDNEYKDVPLISLVQDNHSAHKPEAFYEAYSAKKAKQYLDRLNFEFTPAHGSWLNMAEFELSILSRQALKRFDNKAERASFAHQSWRERHPFALVRCTKVHIMWWLAFGSFLRMSDTWSKTE